MWARAAGRHLDTGEVAPAWVAWVAAVVLPAVLVPVIFGTRVYKGVSDARFRQIVLSLLTCSGIAMLAASVPRLFLAP